MYVKHTLINKNNGIAIIKNGFKLPIINNAQITKLIIYQGINIDLITIVNLNGALLPLNMFTTPKITLIKAISTVKTVEVKNKINNTSKNSSF